MKIGSHKQKVAENAIAMLQRFRRVEDGSLTVFAFVLFMLMVMMGGLAVDLMRFEATRTTLQNTLDRATLASASLTQTLDPESVVYDYFDKSGLSDYLSGVTVVEGLNFRNVTADASAASQPFFMQLIGQTELNAKGHSMAEQRVNNVEIVLVLDVSGSMNSDSKLTNLKTAAKEFVDTVLSSDAEQKISVGIVPFNGQVNLNTDLKAQFTNLVNDPGVANVNCIDLQTDLYDTTAITPSTRLSMTAHADTFTSTNATSSYVEATSTSYAVGYDSTYNYNNVWCPPKSENVVRLPSQSISTLQTQIDSLSAVGATSINAGMKWGVALMDPSLRGAYANLITSKKIADELVGRPFDYTDPEAMKVVVLMTDGEHWAQERVNEDLKSGPSVIYKSDEDGYYSIRHSSGRPSSAGSNEYWVPHLGTWQATPYAKVTATQTPVTTTTYQCGRKSCSWVTSTTYETTYTTGTYTQQDWKQVWSAMRASYVAWQFYARAYVNGYTTRSTGYDAAIAYLRTQVPTATMDAQLQQICSLAKGNGVIVYGIAFEAPTNGQTQISSCATSSAHYFNAQGLQIRTAFRSIASNISQLRLTQ